MSSTAACAGRHQVSLGSARGRALRRRIPENSSVDATTSSQSGHTFGAVWSRRVPTDQVVDREPLERIDYGATHPIARGLGILREGLSLKAIDVEPCFHDAVEPPLLDDMDPPLAPTT